MPNTILNSQEHKKRLLTIAGYLPSRSEYREFSNVLHVGSRITETHIRYMTIEELKFMLIGIKRRQIQELINKLEEDIRKIENYES